MRGLVKLPTHTPEDILNGNNKPAGREMPRTRKHQFYIHDNSPGDRVYGQTTRHSKSQQQNPPDLKILYFGLSITWFVSNIRVQTKVLFQTTRISIRGIVMNIWRCVPPMISKEPKQKTYWHAHSTRDQTKQGIRARFQKEEKRDRFSNWPQIGSFWGRLSKREIKKRS